MKKYLLLLLLICLSISISAQTFQIDRKKSFVKITAWGILTLSNNYYDDKLIEKPDFDKIEQLSTDDIFFLDRISPIDHSQKFNDLSDYTLYAAMGSVLWYLHDDPNFIDDMLVFSEIILAQIAVGKWTKTLSSRYRPFVYSDSVSLEKKQQSDSQHSFYSLHSSTAFSAATFGYYHYYQNNGHSLSYGITMYGLASATATLRIVSAQHFPSDVIVGALAGSGISYLICKFYEFEKIEVNLTNSSFNIGFNF